MNRGESLLVALATYNEIDSLPGLIERIRRHLPHAALLVVDDNSPDGTGRWAVRQAEIDPRFFCVIRPRRLGLGTAARTAFQFAVDREFEWLATMDADGSHDPADLPKLLARAFQSQEPPIDCVIGSRYVEGGKIEGWPWRRRAASRLVNCLSRFRLGLATLDNSTAFRVYRVAALHRLPIETLRSGGYAYLEEILWRLQQAGVRTREVPVTFRDRAHGRSKMSLRVASQKLLDLIRIPWRKEKVSGTKS